MRVRSIHSRRHRRLFWPVLALAYALLVQSILGPAAAGAHAFAMAQHEALGLAMLCDDAGTPTKSAPQQQAPEGDCLSCKIACTASFGVAALPAPETAPLYVVSGLVQPVDPAPSDDRRPSPARYKSDLASRAPPAALI